MITSKELGNYWKKKEAMVAHGPNGRMRVRRTRKSEADKEKLEEALKRVKKRLGVEGTNALKAKWDGLSTGRGGKDHLFGSGLISRVCYSWVYHL